MRKLCVPPSVEARRTMTPLCTFGGVNLLARRVLARTAAQRTAKRTDRHAHSTVGASRVEPTRRGSVVFLFSSAAVWVVQISWRTPRYAML